MLTIPHCKESLSCAYITAVVGRARASIDWSRTHDYGVDGSVKQIIKTGSRHHESGFGFDFQAKSTASWEIEGEYVVYDLEAKTYNDLVGLRLVVHYRFTLFFCVSRRKGRVG